MAKKGYSTAIKRQPYSWYDEKFMNDFRNELNKNDLTFQDFITGAIEDYLKGDYQPKKEGETN